VERLRFQDWFVLGFIVFWVGVFSYLNHLDNYKPNCPAFDTKDEGSKLVPHDMGAVTIEGEECHIIEVDQHVCYIGPYSECKGSYLYCSDRVVSRITKCPSGTVNNSVTRTGGKFSHEEVQ